MTNISDYVCILKYCLESQKGYVEEELDKEYSEFHEGIMRGLDIALEKIESSKFLYENK